MRFLNAVALAPVPLSGVPEQLREAEGPLVWVAGIWEDETFSVKSFGLMERVRGLLVRLNPMVA